MAATAAAEAEAAAARERAAQAERLGGARDRAEIARRPPLSTSSYGGRGGGGGRRRCCATRRFGPGTDLAAGPRRPTCGSARGAAADDAEPEEVWWPIRRPWTAAPLLMSKLSSPAAGSAVRREGAHGPGGGAGGGCRSGRRRRRGGHQTRRRHERAARPSTWRSRWIESPPRATTMKWAALRQPHCAWRRADAGSGPGGRRRAPIPARRRRGAARRRRPARPGPRLFGSPSAPSLPP